MTQRELMAFVSAPMMPLFAYRLQSRTRTARTPDDYLQIAETLRLGPAHIKPIQLHSELATLIRLLAERKPTRVLEIGTARGGTLYLLARIADPKAMLLSIDLPGGAFGDGYPNWKTPLFRSFAGQDQSIYLLREDSHASSTLGAVQDILAPEKLDLLFVDGDHTYEGVSQDWAMYSPLVSSGGMIVFHDIVPGTPERSGGVPRFWQQLKTQYNYQEIVESWDQNGFGIGIIFK